MRSKKIKPVILILGASGMLGNAILRFFSQCKEYQVFGTVRSKNAIDLFPNYLQSNIFYDVNVESMDKLITLFCKVQPKYVINCIGLIKQLPEANDPILAISLNAMFPHRLAQLCSVAGSRMIHFSTDCVFSGIKGMYKENDATDASDLYGKSKYLGELSYPNTITLRTSIIGHELGKGNSLLEWFLGQEKEVIGFKRAIFSGLTTLEIANIIKKFILPNPNLYGLYHVSSEPICKHDLLELIAKIYHKKIKIIPDENVKINRSLDSNKFKIATGYTPPSWPEMINSTYNDRKIWNKYV